MTETKIEDNIAAAYEWAQSHKPPHPRVGIKFEDFREAFLMLRCPMALSLAESEGVEMLNVFGSDEDTEFHRTLSMACDWIPREDDIPIGIRKAMDVVGEWFDVSLRWTEHKNGKHTCSMIVLCDPSPHDEFIPSTSSCFRNWERKVEAQTRSIGTLSETDLMDGYGGAS